ncbi:MAG: hypothetical protein CFE37_09790 [Alphaproteobacteria bacterium PA4]|nr:MAG: hypothetical protein CFE37_09790 [Alphaproteobacteria bacterium PA4]
MKGRRRLGIIGRSLVTLLLLVGGVWGGMALWSRLLDGPLLRYGLVAAFAVATLAAVAALWARQRLALLVIVALSWGPLLGWWDGIAPSADRDWQPDVARVAQASINGDELIVGNVRNFTWRSDTDFDQRWETRSYRLSQLTGADLFLSYWAGEAIAHAIVSFTFADQPPLAFSIEIRKERGEAYSATAGFFKTYELAIIAADERDVVKVRSTVRGEDVRLYHLDIQQKTARALLGEYVALANDVAETPRWYNTLSANCTTLIFGMARRLDPRVEMDWRILLPGRLPEYLYVHDFVSHRVPLAELTARSHIGPRAKAPPPDYGFSDRIRQGVPLP